MNFTKQLAKLEKYQPPEGPVVLIILDGVGIYPKPGFIGNSVELAYPKNFSKWIEKAKSENKYCQLKAHGPAVGLPTDDDMGNSEVGHNAMGAGQIYAQGAKLVNLSIEQKTMFKSEVWDKMVLSLAKSPKNGKPGATLHLIGLLSDGNVHSHINQLFGILEQAKHDNVKRVRVHPLLDGRDVDPKSAPKYINMLEQKLKELSVGGFDYRIASGGGRMYVTMDRYFSDWNVVRRGYYAHTHGIIHDDVYGNGFFIGYPGYFFNSMQAIETARLIGGNALKAQKEMELLKAIFKDEKINKKTLSEQEKNSLKEVSKQYWNAVYQLNLELQNKIWNTIKQKYLNKTSESQSNGDFLTTTIAELSVSPDLKDLQSQIDSLKSKIAELKGLTVEDLKGELKKKMDEVMAKQNFEMTDQVNPPWVIVDEKLEPIGKMEDGDSVIFYNFRGDRAIEISMAYEQGDEFKGFDRGKRPNINYAGLLRYDGDLGIPKNYLVPPPQIENTSGQYLCNMGIKTFAIAETHKFGHVTYFWNGNRSGYINEALEKYTEIKSEPSEMIQGHPEMMAVEVKDEVIKQIESGKYQYIRINFANGDMVGHTGDVNAATRAVRCVSDCVDEIIELVLKKKGVVIVTADHGNCEEMFEKNGKTPKTSHTLNPVPFFIIESEPEKRKYHVSTEGIQTPGIANVAATLMNILGFQAPDFYEKTLIKFD
jgi:bisphosphoglycerate-independent phosphoglycerate mutase (AlkP superfamily)